MSFFSGSMPGQPAPASQGSQATPRRQQVPRPYTPPQLPSSESPDKGVGAGSGGGSAQKGRGRPKEDLGSRADKLFQEFGSAERSHIRFFGSERKTQVKALYRLTQDITVAESETQDEEEVTRLVIMRKKVTAVMNLCKAFHKQSGFLEGYNEVFMFAALPPKVEDIPCPVWMCQHAYKLRAQCAASPNLFWALLTDTALREAKFEERDYMMVKVQIIADRCLDIARQDDGNVRGRLRDLFAPDILSHFEIAESLKSKTLPTYHVCMFDSSTVKLDVLESSIRQVEDPQETIGSALLTLPAGRNIVEAAKKHMKKLRAQSTIVHVIAGHVEALDAVLPQDGGDGTVVDWLAVGAAWKVCDAKLSAEDFLRAPEVVEKVAKTRFKLDGRLSQISCCSPHMIFDHAII